MMAADRPEDTVTSAIAFSRTGVGIRLMAAGYLSSVHGIANFVDAVEPTVCRTSIRRAAQLRKVPGSHTAAAVVAQRASGAKHRGIGAQYQLGRYLLHVGRQAALALEARAKWAG